LLLVVVENACEAGFAARLTKMRDEAENTSQSLSDTERESQKGLPYISFNHLNSFSLARESSYLNKNLAKRVGESRRFIEISSPSPSVPSSPSSHVHPYSS
jgi:hypothetical protein